ncbi:MAG TPA: Holliday junction resolvase RuvX [Anaerolineae bacterium]|nr:Holliday junction resolvase RuvX [Anaerolineae bacterium]
MKLLALDVGDRRVGVAVSDANGLVASPLTVLRRASKAEDFARIARLAREQGVTGLVIGHPLNADGSAGPQARRVERYAAALAETLQSEGLELVVLLRDEFMSTMRAQEIMITTGRKRKDRQARIDAVAAAVILQDYLDEERR